MTANNRIIFTMLRARCGRRLTSLAAICLLALSMTGVCIAQTGERLGSGEATQFLTGTVDRVSLSTGTIIIDGRAFGLAESRSSNADFDAGPAHASRLQNQLSRLQPGDAVELSFLPAGNSSRMEGRLVMIRKIR